jgi:acyl homoserine lactone synthase
MIIIVEEHNAHEHRDLLREMYRLRTRVFRDRLGWDVTVVDGLERDRYDEEAPVYLILADEEAKRVIGSLRLLPTTGPTLLADLFSDTLPDAAFLSAPSIWECTRFCLDEELLATAGRAEVLLASGRLLAALGQVALKAGIVTILGNFAPSMLRVYRRIGCEVEVLGTTHRYGGPVHLGAFRVSADHLRQIEGRVAALQAAIRPAELGLAA